jgi:hypothetical protein
MPEVMLDRPCIVSVVCQLVAAGMAKHVGVDRETKLSVFARSAGASAAQSDSIVTMRYF